VSDSADLQQIQIPDAFTHPTGLHYRFSGVAGVLLGQNVADSALRPASHPIG